MEKIRGYELSKSFGIPSKEIVKVLHDYGVSDKNHMSTLTEYELDVIFEYYTQKNQVADFSMYEPKPAEEKPVEKEEPSAQEEPVLEEIEIVRKTRTVDTRVNTVELDRLDDEKVEELIPDYVKDDGAKKQKINQKKKQQKKIRRYCCCILAYCNSNLSRNQLYNKLMGLYLDCMACCRCSLPCIYIYC